MPGNVISWVRFTSNQNLLKGDIWYMFQLIWRMEQWAMSSQATLDITTGQLRQSLNISTPPIHTLSSGHFIFHLLAENLQNMINIYYWDASVPEDWYLLRTKMWYYLGFAFSYSFYNVNKSSFDMDWPESMSVSWEKCILYSEQIHTTWHRT